MGRTELFAYDFQTNRIPGDPVAQEPYWRDVGTIDAYYDANMDLRAVKPALNLYNRQWPLRTASYPDPPAKFIFDEEGRRGQAIDSIVAGGTILSGGVGDETPCWAAACASTPAPWWKIPFSSITATSAAAPACAARSSIRMCASPKTPASATISSTTAAYHVTDSGIVVVEGHRSMVEVASMLV